MNAHLSHQVLYKSLSSPCVLESITSADTLLLDPSDDVTNMNTTVLLQDCTQQELHDVLQDCTQHDVVSDLNDSSRTIPLAHSVFKDSYDPFCHSESADVSYRDLPGVPRKLEVKEKCYYL